MTIAERCNKIATFGLNTLMNIIALAQMSFEAHLEVFVGNCR